MNGIGPELPLSRDVRFGAYSLVTSYKNEVRQNFKNLLLTAPGERVMNPDFGVGLRQFLFEPRVNIIPKIKQRIYAQVEKYLPFIKINSLIFDSGQSAGMLEESNVLSIRIEFEVPSLNLSTELILQSEDIN